VNRRLDEAAVAGRAKSSATRRHATAPPVSNVQFQVRRSAPPERRRRCRRPFRLIGDKRSADTAATVSKVFGASSHPTDCIGRKHGAEAAARCRARLRNRRRLRAPRQTENKRKLCTRNCSTATYWNQCDF